MAKPSRKRLPAPIFPSTSSASPFDVWEAVGSLGLEALGYSLDAEPGEPRAVNPPDRAFPKDRGWAFGKDLQGCRHQDAREAGL